MTKETIYKGHTITANLSGWYSALTARGYVKADTIQGVKTLIDNVIKAQHQKETNNCK